MLTLRKKNRGTFVAWSCEHFRALEEGQHQVIMHYAFSFRKLKLLILSINFVYITEPSSKLLETFGGCQSGSRHSTRRPYHVTGQ